MSISSFSSKTRHIQEEKAFLKESEQEIREILVHYKFLKL